MDRLARHTRQRATSRSSKTACCCARCSLSAEDVAEYYEGFSNATLWPLYHDVIVKPIYHREWWDRYVEVNRRFAEATAQDGRRGRHRVGSGLPAAAGSEDAAHAAARPDHRVLPAHPVPAGRAVHADAVAHRDHRGSARRRSGRLPPARRRTELPDPGPPARRRQHLARAPSACGPASARCKSASAQSRSAPSRSPSIRPRSTSSRGPRDPAAGQGDPQRARQSAQDPARCRPAGLHQGHRRPAEGILGATRRAPGQSRGHRAGSARDAEPGTRRELHRDARRHRTPGRPYQR